MSVYEVGSIIWAMTGQQSLHALQNYFYTIYLNTNYTPVMLLIRIYFKCIFSLRDEHFVKWRLFQETILCSVFCPLIATARHFSLISNKCFESCPCCFFKDELRTSQLVEHNLFFRTRTKSEDDEWFLGVNELPNIIFRGLELVDFQMLCCPLSFRRIDLCLLYRMCYFFLQRGARCV